MTVEHPNHPLMAALLMIAAMTIIGVIDNFIAPLSRHMGLWQFHFIRALMAAPLVVGLSLIGLGSLRPLRWWAVALRSVLLGIAMLFYFTALAIMPIAQALAGLFTSPIFILLITAFGLRQTIGIWRIFSVALGFAGILCVLQPDPSDFDMRLFIPVTAGFFYALAAIATRSLCARESTVALLAGMWVTLCLMGAAGSLALLVFPASDPAAASDFVTRPWVWPLDAAWPYLLVQAVGSVSGVFLIIKAYQLGEPSYVSVFEYSVMVFGPLFAWVVFAVPVGPWQIFGIAMIALAGAIIAVRSK